MEKIPKGAMRFVEAGPDCYAMAEAGEDGKTPKLKMVGYSGGIIKGHWYWGDLAIDLEGMSFPLSKYPILEDHWTEAKIAFTGKPDLSNGKLEINPKTTKFLDTEASLEFQKNSMAGFPYQSSIYAKPSVVERLDENGKSKVNGMSVKGPMSIWRKSEFKECSVCVFGWDSKTSATAFSKTETEDVDIEFLGEGDGNNNDNSLIKEVIQIMPELTVAELKKQSPELVAQLTQEITDEVTAAVTETLTAQFSEERTALEAKLTAKKEELTTMGDRVLSLEKNEILREEKAIQLQADRVWDNKLANSQVAERLHEKARIHVTHDKFVKEGVFDVTAFSAAVDAEIKDWEDKGATSTVLGSSFSSGKDETGDDNTKLADDADDAVVISMQKAAGMFKKG